MPFARAFGCVGCDVILLIFLSLGKAHQGKISENFISNLVVYAVKWARFFQNIRLICVNVGMNLKLNFCNYQKVPWCLTSKVGKLLNSKAGKLLNLYSPKAKGLSTLSGFSLTTHICNKTASVWDTVWTSCSAVNPVCAMCIQSAHLNSLMKWVLSFCIYDLHLYRWYPSSESTWILVS